MSARIFVPGRIEVLGKHTDYAGGSSLLVAIDRGFTFHAEARDDDQIVVTAEDSQEEVRYTLQRTGSAAVVTPWETPTVQARGVAHVTTVSPDHTPAGTPHGAAAGEQTRAARPSWARYVDGVLTQTLAGFGEAARGVHVRFRSDLPVAAGLSSSSALVTGLFLALDHVCRFSDLPAFRQTLPDRHALAGWLSAAEMGGPVGTRGGSEDHVAILCAQPGRIVRYRLAPIRYRGAVPVPQGWSFAVGVSGVAADKGGAVQAHYNRLSDLAARAAEAWNAASPARHAAPNLGHALEQAVDPAAVLARVQSGSAELGFDAADVVRRTRHFLEECALVDAAFDALDHGRIDAFAIAANHSAALGAELLENQVPETLRLAELARQLGAPAASPFGGGFGGAVWAIVHDSHASEFLQRWHESYAQAFPYRTAAQFFTTTAGGPAGTLTDRASARVRGT